MARTRHRLRPSEVAAHFGVHTSTLARWADQGRLDFIRLPGGKRRYDLESVRRLLAEMKGGSSA